MGNIDTLIKNIEGVPEVVLRQYESQLIDTIIATNDSKSYEILADRLGIEPSTSVERDLLEQAEAERLHQNRNSMSNRNLTIIEQRIKQRIYSILNESSTEEVYAKSLISNIYNGRIHGKPVSELSYGEAIKIANYIRGKAKELSKTRI